MTIIIIEAMIISQNNSACLRTAVAAAKKNTAHSHTFFHTLPRISHIAIEFLLLKW